MKAKHLHALSLVLSLLLGIGCDEASEQIRDAGTDSGIRPDSGTDSGVVCEAPVDGMNATFLNRGACADERVECEPFDNARIPSGN